jgi:hypothetical protein
MQLTLLAALALGASTKEPCVEAIAEFAAYETLLRSDEFFPLASGSLNSPIPIKFGSADAWEPVYYSIRARIDALAALAAERSGCEIEKLGCFQRFLGAHTAMLALQKGGGNETLTATSFVTFRSKTLRWAMSNMLWLVDACEKQVAKQRKDGKTSAIGPVEYP